MKIQIIYDNEAISSNLNTGWGFSVLIDNKILFDTGENDNDLIDNLNKLNIDLNQIEIIIISHEHWDHTGAVYSLLKLNPHIKLYTCPGFSLPFKLKLQQTGKCIHEVSQNLKITDHVFSSGEFYCKYKGQDIFEQAVIIKTAKGFSVITGCSHPGIIKILETIKTNLNIDNFYAVIGGMHLKDMTESEINSIIKEFSKINVTNVGPSHCSGKAAENLFHENYEDNFFDLKVGKTFEI